MLIEASLRIVHKLLYFWGHISPKTLMSYRFYKVFHRRLNWKNPQDLNEKINWLKLYSDNSEWSQLADKYAVRKYLEEKGLSKHLVKLLGKWDSPNDIDFTSLPDQFILKMNNGSGDVLICQDKQKLDKKATIQHFSNYFNEQFSYITVEPHYRNIKPCIIAEELLDASKQTIPSSSLVDYKIWCFNGKPYSVEVYWDRHNSQVQVAYFDLDWNYHPEWQVSSSHYQIGTFIPPKPEKFSEMLRIATILAEGFPEVRVDLYLVDQNIYFGEMTFTACTGLENTYTYDWLLHAGQQIQL